MAMSASYLGTFLHHIILRANIYYLLLYYEGVLGYSPVIAGVTTFPESFTETLAYDRCYMVNGSLSLGNCSPDRRSLA
ncbi:Efflux pump [Penicillium cinerascens]|uniref:Efflux pump n=1 Tax=Penicillium cinerascens TaxID=70096 RepID=A0A9W9J7B6_9EURO|nr:Efflux pump [Penicillium cinerascens]KAJ5190551.1 Efflux pump [Penicillium cinerascens]